MGRIALARSDASAAAVFTNLAVARAVRAKRTSSRGGSGTGSPSASIRYSAGISVLRSRKYCRTMTACASGSRRIQFPGVRTGERVISKVPSAATSRSWSDRLTSRVVACFDSDE
ncbi:hypothetical protein GCM10023085_07140 [Actinomadura viridis]|uniref:Uncharacterized protein n=1 Tax=Actinomadura viridis TaxID=58110 RepID=A0A931DNC4_9ACTN|nr:hypothetical protein [Actinomadura viridis]MBG6091723.1 hypothetical protein [Actinomadura viridis]